MITTTVGNAEPKRAGKWWTGISLVPESLNPTLKLHIYLPCNVGILRKALGRLFLVSPKCDDQLGGLGVDLKAFLVYCHEGY